MKVSKEKNKGLKATMEIKPRAVKEIIPFEGVTPVILKEELNFMQYRLFNGINKVLIQDNEAISERFDILEAKLNIIISKLNEIEG